MWAMLVYRGAAAFVGMLAHIVHVVFPLLSMQFLPHSHRKGLKLGLLVWKRGVTGGDPEPHGSLAGHQACWYKKQCWHHL